MQTWGGLPNRLFSIFKKKSVFKVLLELSHYLDLVIKVTH